jgi:hypothetical protein
MSRFLFAYRAPRNYKPGSPDVMAAWSTWFESMGPSLEERGNPVFERSSLGSSGGDTVLGGYSIVTADGLEAAVTLAKGCPALKVGGGVEVGELTSLN